MSSAFASIALEAKKQMFPLIKILVTYNSAPDDCVIDQAWLNLALFQGGSGSPSMDSSMWMTILSRVYLVIGQG